LEKAKEYVDSFKSSNTEKIIVHCEGTKFEIIPDASEN